MLNLRADASLASTDPDTVLLSPEHDLKGYDKIGAMLIMGNNRYR